MTTDRKTKQRLTTIRQQIAQQDKKRNVPQPEAVMDRLWRRMTETFGRQFEASYGGMGGSAYETWRQGLSDMSLDEIGQGFERMVKDGGRFPPNLPEFRAFCRPAEDTSRVQTYSSQVYTGHHKLLTRQKNPDSEAAKEHFEAVSNLYGRQK